MELTDSYELQIKISKMISERFFSNITVANFFSWKHEQLSKSIVRLPIKDAFQIGIHIIGDYNDRYAFNENESYQSSKKNARAIIDGGINEIQKMIDYIRSKP